MIVVSPTGEPVENIIVISINITYITFIIGYSLWINYKNKKNG